ncbi:MAG: arginase family protein [Candidatus Hodarchaeales archaeon]|jgi:arginase
MKLSLIEVPFHLGKERVGMGLGPIKIMKSGIIQDLLDYGHDIRIEAVRYDKQFEKELNAIVDLNNRLKAIVEKVMIDGYFPLILGGNCNTCFGTLAGLNSSNTGIIWFDAHGDFNTPETTPSGFLDGMPLAIATGQCYRDIWSQIADIDPVNESFILHIGERDLDPEERILLMSTNITVISSSELKETNLSDVLVPSVKDLKTRINDVYLHIDIDVLDPQEAPGVDYRSPNGLSSDKLDKIIKMIAENLPIKAAAITAYNPKHEENDKTLNVIRNLIVQLPGILSNSQEVFL